MSASVWMLLAAAEQRLNASGVPDARLDAEYLLAEALHAPRLSLLLEKGRLLSGQEESAFERLLARREKREPLQYILGTQSFMGLPLKTDCRALIPRNDTESVCEAALAALGPGQRALDLCTGTGAIALALKKLCPLAEVTAADLSADALSLARENAAALGADVRFLQGDLFSPVAGQRFDLIISNPPYIPLSEGPALQEEVKREPSLALFAGADGLAFYRRIAREAPGFLLAGGRLFLEIGDGQFDAVAALLAPAFTGIEAIFDLGGLVRGISCALREGAPSGG